MKKCIILLVFSLLCSGIVNAAILNVPTEYSSIQIGIDSSVNGDTVLVQPGTYVENINYNGKNITVASLFLTTADTSYISQTIIDGDSLDSVVKFESGEDSTAVLIGFTIQNGNEHFGGGMNCNHSSPSLQNVTIIDNNAYYSGGGIYCDNSNPYLENVHIIGNSTNNDGGGISCTHSSPCLKNVTITGNSAFDDGGGMFCNHSSPVLINVTISYNSASGDVTSGGGGIYCTDSSPSLENVTISDNIASGNGGGIYCDNSSLILDNVTISDNNAFYYGGGISCSESTLCFSETNRCNIYSNTTENTRGFGVDIFASNCAPIDVIVDTFTVLTPTDYYASPINNFVFDILNFIHDNLINADVYVSVDGDNSNSGIFPNEPFKTINHALSMIYSDSLNNNTIHLAQGVYSDSTNGETFPIYWSNYVNLSGGDEYETILDANNRSGVMQFTYISDAIIDNITIKNGVFSYGGGISCSHSSPCLKNVTITGNIATEQGGGIYYYNSSPSLENVTISYNSVSGYGGGGICCCNDSSPSLQNVTIIDNNAYYSGGGMYCEYSSPSLENVTISGNTGGGIHCDNSNPYLENVHIIGNSTNNCGGGIYYYNSSPCLKNVTIKGNSAFDDGGGMFCNHSSPVLINVTISYNSASGDVTSGGGGICCCNDSSPSLENVTIIGNSANYKGGGIRCSHSSPSLVNSIVSDNTGNYGIYAFLGNPIITYSDFFNNEGGNFHGVNDSIGVNVTTNANGDSCDVFYNIQLDPLFVDPLNGDYHLSWANYPIPDSTMSPCIDAGDPTSPLDPDSTIADMGAYYYHQPVSINEPEDNADFTIWNFPNPTKNSTTILYSLKKNSHVMISIYNIKGQLVTTLVNESKSQGEYSVEFETKALSSGVYFYKIQTEDRSEIKKMIVIR